MKKMNLFRWHLYLLRRWLFLKLMPKNLAVYLWEGISEAQVPKGTGLLDLDTRMGWGSVKTDWTKFTFTFGPIVETTPDSATKK